MLDTSTGWHQHCNCYKIVELLYGNIVTFLRILLYEKIGFFNDYIGYFFGEKFRQYYYILKSIRDIYITISVLFLDVLVFQIFSSSPYLKITSLSLWDSGTYSLPQYLNSSSSLRESPSLITFIINVTSDSVSQHSDSLYFRFLPFERSLMAPF